MGIIPFVDQTKMAVADTQAHPTVLWFTQNGGTAGMNRSVRFVGWHGVLPFTIGPLPAIIGTCAPPLKKLETDATPHGNGLSQRL
jgi:hypothetical protein